MYQTMYSFRDLIYTCVPVSLLLISRSFGCISATRFLQCSEIPTRHGSCIMYFTSKGRRRSFCSKSMSGKDRPNRTKEHSDLWWSLCLLIPIRLFSGNQYIVLQTRCHYRSIEGRDKIRTEQQVGVMIISRKGSG